MTIRDLIIALMPYDLDEEIQFAGVEGGFEVCPINGVGYNNHGELHIF